MSFKTWLALLLLLLGLAPLQARELPTGVAWLWEFQDVVSVPPIMQGNIAVVVVDNLAMGLRTSDGQRLWETKLPASWRSEVSPLVVGGLVILPASGGKVVALDIASGAERWSTSAASSSPQLCAGRLVVIDTENLSALDPNTGEVRWRTAGTFQEMAVHGSRIFTATREELAVYDLTSGKSLWRQRAKELSGLRLNSLVALSSRGALVARDPSTGKKLWSLPDVGEYEALGDRVLAWSSYNLVAVVARTGQRLWSQEDYGTSIAEAGPFLYAVDSNSRLALLDRKTGKLVRSLQAQYPPLLAGDQLLIAGQDGHLYRAEARTGRLQSGIRDVWGQSYASNAGPPGLNNGKLKLLPAGSALVALGEGPGVAHWAGEPKVELQVARQIAPGKIPVSTTTEFARKVSLSAYRSSAPLDETTLDQATLGEPVASMTWHSTSGQQDRRSEKTITLKEPGNYILEANAGTQRARRMVTVTPVGLAVKLAPGQLLVQALDVVRNVPLPGVSVQVAKLGDVMEPGISGVTGSDGLLRLETREALDQPLSLRIQRAAENFTFDINPARFPSTQKVYLQTDRPLYRPGHEVFFKGLVGGGEGVERAPVQGAKVSVEVRDSQDNPLLSQDFTSDEWGVFSGSLKLPAEPPLGRYRVSAKLDADQEAFHLPFEVEEYRKPPFEVLITTRSPLVRAGQPLGFDLRASYFFGGPVPGAKVKVTVRRASLSGRPTPGNPGYHSYADFVSEDERVLGPDGRLSFEVPTMAGFADSEYLIDAEVTGPSGQVVEGAASGLASAGPYGVYLNAAGWTLDPGETVTLGVETIDLLAQPRPGVVLLEVRDLRFDKVVAKATLKTGANGKATYSWTAPKTGGDFSVRVSSPEKALAGRVLDEHNYWVYSQDVSPSGARSLRSERSEYRVGDTARLLLQSTASGPALLTVEGSQIHQSRLFTVKEGAQWLSFQVEPSMASGVAVKVQMVEDGRIAQQTASFDVPDTEHQLKVQIRADKPEYRPGESALLELTITDLEGRPVNANASLAVVDEALFALRPDQVPAIHGAFFGPRENRVQSFLMVPAPNEVAGFQTVPTPTRVRKDFKDTAYWQPSVMVTDGKAQVSVPMPDNLTRWRATSRASTQTLQVGHSTTTFLSNLPLMAQAILPRFLVEGDGVDLLALVTNRTKSPVDVDVKLAATPGELETSAGRVEALAADGQGRVVSRLKVEENVLGKTPLPSRLEVQVDAQTPGAAPPESDAEQISIPILPFGKPYAKGKAGIVKAGESAEMRLDGPRALLKPRLEIRVAGSPLAALEGALEYLADFPYGCVEQTMSRFLPTVVAAQALGDLGLFSAERKTAIAPMVDKGLSALYGYQHSDGGWGWWVDDPTHPYMTGYVIAGLSMARQAGYQISDVVLKRGVSSAEFQLSKLDPKDMDTRVYLAWALSMAGAPPVEILTVLSATPSAELGTYSTALLALAWQSADQPARALPLVEELERRAKPAGIGVSWPARAMTAYGWTDDEVEATALAMRAVLAAKPDSEIAAGAVPWLLSQREGASWKSTRDTAQAVLALLDFAGHQKAASAPRTGTLALSWDGEALPEVTLGAKEVVVSVPADLLSAGPHVLKLSSSGSPAIYSYSYTGFQREKEQVDLPADYGGLRLLRTYIVEQPGKLLRQNRVTPPEILDVASGQEVTVEIEMDLPNRMQYLKLEDPRPAGFEVMEERVEGSVRPDRQENRDAFTAFFFTSLPAGKHYFSYRMRAETPGDYRSLPARLELMYQPQVYGTTPSQRVKVRRVGESS